MTGGPISAQAGPAIRTEPVYDVVVAGSGVAGLTAAAFAAHAGLSVLLVEKAARIGGTSAISGGMIWAPANRLAAAAGIRDTREAAGRYLAGTVENAAADPVLAAFVDSAADALDGLQSDLGIALQPVTRYPDYYQAAEGATLGGRVVEAQPVDIRALGPAQRLLAPPLRELTLFGGMMVSRADLPAFRTPFGSLGNLTKIGRLTSRYLYDRATVGRGGHLVLGNALVARLLKACIDNGVTIATETSLAGIELEDGRAGAVEVEQGNGSRRIKVRQGVILAGGGFSHHAALRARFLPPQAAAHSAAEPVDAGETISAALAVGASMRGMAADNALWVPLSTFTRKDGTAARLPHTVTDRGKPGLIAVTPDGRRFVNEAMNYHHFCQALLRATPHNATARAFLICDADFLWRYGLGAAMPFGIGRRAMLANGYLRQAGTIEGLAQALKIPPAALAETVSRYNEDARRGEDREFGRGSDEYQRHFGDPDRQPNPNVAPIERSPYYAIEVVAADLGTAAGLDTDRDAHVLDESGTPIGALYACGNDMRSVMNGSYPGPGITLGPAVVFAWRAVRAIMGDAAS